MVYLMVSQRKSKGFYFEWLNQRAKIYWNFIRKKKLSEQKKLDFN